MNAPYATKILKKTGNSVMAYQSTWLVEETFSCNELIIRPRAVLMAPEGKFLTLTVDGVGQKIEPGTYKGDVVLSVTDAYHMRPGGLMRPNQISRDFHTGIVVENGKVTKTIPAIVQGGSIEDGKVEGVYMASREDSFNGIVVDGEGECTIKDVKADFDGFGDNDFLGVGCAVTVVGNPTVTIEDCDFTVNGVTRCAVHVGGTSTVTVKNTKLTNICPEDTWPGCFSWQVGFCGSNRLAQFTDAANVTYDGCDLKTNGWGVFSIDGCDDSANIFVKDCNVELSGPRAVGYGAFCIGDRNIVSFDHSNVHVDGYPLLVRGMIGAARAEIVNGCEVTGNRNGVFVIGDKNTPVTISDSSIVTGKSTIVVKGSATDFHITNSHLQAGNGTILQLHDNDEGGMDATSVVVATDEKDEYVEGRDLTAFDPALDVSAELVDMTVEGNFFNSTTNLHMEQYLRNDDAPTTAPTFGGMFAPPADAPAGGPGAPGGPEGAPGADHPDPHMGHDKDLRGPKNMLIELKNTRVEGIISSAAQSYREGVKVINQANRLELSNITQTAAPTVNNGVIVRMDRFSSWLVTGTSYITALELGENAIVKGAHGKKLVMTVDGVETPVEWGHSYYGKIVLSLAD